MNTIVYNRTMIAVNSNLIRRCYCTKHWCLNQKLLYPPITKLSAIFPAPSSSNYMLNPPSSLPASLSSLQIRDFHLLTALRAQEPSSKVEETVKRLKEEQEDKEKSVPAVETAEKALAEKRTIWQKVKAELLHYYHGFRLLGLDMKIAFKLVVRMLQGHELTRREHRLLVKTTGDMFRLIPFSVFIIVPFMEFLLPVFIKFFPGMLPSTFQTATDKENKLKQALKVKIEMAKFLQKTLDEMAVQSSDHRSVTAKEFSEFFCKLRSTGEVASTEDIMKFSKLFEDEITLDSLSRQQLVALCRVLDTQTLGTSNFLRFLLRMKLRNLAADDRVIEKEGVETLTRAELQQACRARGMRAYGMPENRLRDQLNQWLDLSIHKKVPPSLLLLSRAMMIPDTIPMSDKLKATISALPDDVLARTKGAIGDKEGKVDHRTNIEIIKLEEKRIEEERQEQKAQEAPEPVVQENEKVPEITTTDVKVLEQALDSIGQEKKMAVEKEELKELKEEMAEYVEDIQELDEIKAEAKKVGGSEIEDLKVSKGASRLYKKVNKMISKMDKVLEELEVEEKQVKEKIEGLKHEEKNVEGDVVEELVRIDELIAAIKNIQSVPDDEKLNRMQEILGEIDVDRDGAIKIEDVLKVIELIGKDDIKLNKKQMNELIKLMEKEEVLEVEDQIQKALLKESKESKLSTTTTTSKSTVPATPVAKAEKISEEGFINEIPEISVKATDVANDVCQPSKSVKNGKNKISTKEKKSDPEELKDPAPIITDSIDKTISSTPPVTSTVPPPKTKKLKD
ncbi:mitochondrial proton/calcium exchanger protein-like isoform X2 [Cotesia glomerata]|uniref:mitochondrial proton/calcium exchanger protein-like isoform X2 n=1 Tax=Cotesia glomerata TaxID=32391 RepID=UPI001D02C358|nr:mitochondrial proton/calcium exchanger protein-like isoform X2 [Cotesia glomerata]